MSKCNFLAWGGLKWNCMYNGNICYGLEMHLLRFAGQTSSTGNSDFTLESYSREPFWISYIPHTRTSKLRSFCSSKLIRENKYTSHVSYHHQNIQQIKLFLITRWPSPTPWLPSFTVFLYNLYSAEQENFDCSVICLLCYVSIHVCFHTTSPVLLTNMTK